MLKTGVLQFFLNIFTESLKEKIFKDLKERIYWPQTLWQMNTFLYKITCIFCTNWTNEEKQHTCKLPACTSHHNRYTSICAISYFCCLYHFNYFMMMIVFLVPYMWRIVRTFILKLISSMPLVVYFHFHCHLLRHFLQVLRKTTFNIQFKLNDTSGCEHSNQL